MKLNLTVPDGIEDDLRDFRLSQEDRTLRGLIQQAVHCDEGLAG